MATSARRINDTTARRLIFNKPDMYVFPWTPVDYVPDVFLSSELTDDEDTEMADPPPKKVKPTPRARRVKTEDDDDAEYKPYVRC